MSRASWGIVEVDDEGRVLASLSGNVPATMPQTPQSGEHLGHAYAVQHLQSKATLSGDCKAVVNAAQTTRFDPLTGNACTQLPPFLCVTPRPSDL